MLKAAVEGLREGAESVGLQLGVLGVTVLTSRQLKMIEYHFSMSNSLELDAKGNMRCT